MTTQDAKKEIIKRLEEISGQYSKYTVFNDWVEMMALSIANGCTIWRDKIWEDREKQYQAIADRYTEDQIGKMTAMMGLLVMGMEAEPRDILGEVFMEAQLRSREAGQFFTPFHLSLLSAKMAIQRDVEKFKNGAAEKIEFLEPSCGAGGMIIAVARILQETGINYQKTMKVVTQDLDWRCVYMCYVQLSILGIDAICVQGDTLMEPYDINKTEKTHMLLTPNARGALV